MSGPRSVHAPSWAPARTTTWSSFSTAPGGCGSRLRTYAKVPLGFVLRTAARYSARGAGVAVLYHVITAASEVDPDTLVQTTPVQVLDQHIRHLSRHYQVVVASQLQSAAGAHRRGQRQPASVTFDDDHWSYVPLVLPVLRRYGVRATFFLNGASLREPYFFPWERLEAAWYGGAMDLLLEKIPGSVAIAARDRRPPLESVSLALTALPRLVRAEVERMLEDVVPPEAMPPRMTADDVRAVVAAGHEIGFHTRAHEHLTELSDVELDDAMSDGRAELEELLPAPISVLAYPFGDWNPRVARAAERAGFRCAFTVDPVAVRPSSPPHGLGRIPGPLAGTATMSFVTSRMAVGRRGAPETPPGYSW